MNSTVYAEEPKNIVLKNYKLRVLSLSPLKMLFAFNNINNHNKNSQKELGSGLISLQITSPQ